MRTHQLFPRIRRTRSAATGDPLKTLPQEAVVRYFRPTSRFGDLVEGSQGAVNKIAIFFHACYLEAFGRTAPPGPIPDFLVTHIAEILGVEAELPLPYPGLKRTYFKHVERVRRALGWTTCDAKCKKSIEKWLLTEASRSDDPDWLRDRLERKLMAARIILPGSSRIARFVGRARKKAQDEAARELGKALFPAQRDAIDRLRRPKPGSGGSHLQWLKNPVGLPSPRALLDILDRIEFIRTFQLSHELFDRIHPDMRRRMTKTVEVYTADSLWEDFPDERRRSLLACYLHERHRALVDLAVEVFDGIVLKMNRHSEADLAEDLRNRGPAINEKLLILRDMIDVVTDEAGVPNPVVRPTIYDKVPRDVLLAARAELEELIRPPDYNVFDYLEARYSYLRSFFPRFLRVIEFEGVPTARPLLQAVAALRYWNAEGIRKPPTDPPLDFVPKKWRSYVIRKDGLIDRHYYELCVMLELRMSLQATDVWVVGGRRYGNVEDLLIPPETWRDIRDECYEELRLPRDGKKWLASVLPTLEKQIQTTADRLLENPYAIVEEDRVHLSPFEASLLPPEVEHLKSRIKESWPQIRIQDLLVEVDSWVRFSDCFRTLRGYHKTGIDFERTLYAALIGKGCNIGTVRMASLTPAVGERALRRVDELYLYEDTLRESYERLQAAHRSLPIANWLGEERVSMSDGMRVGTRVGTVKAALLPHTLPPGQRAITYYWHVSHQGPGYSAQVFGHDRDAAYVLDQIFHVQSELPIHEHYTDTHGTTETTFGLAYVLGVEFAPRIKLVHHQDLYFPPGMKIEGPLKKHFEGPVDTDLIETYWDDVVRILASIHRGHTSAVLLSLRLSSYARQNPLYRALREVGRIFKSRFIMRYYDEVDFRRKINTGLNRMEFFNALARHLFYARRGENWERELEQQLNRASALLILANACVLWNTVHLTETVRSLREIGVRFSPGDFRHVSPYAFEHIVPYGQYFFTRKKDRQAAFALAQEL